MTVPSFGVNEIKQPKNRTSSFLLVTFSTLVALFIFSASIIPELGGSRLRSSLGVQGGRAQSAQSGKDVPDPEDDLAWKAFDLAIIGEGASDAPQSLNNEPAFIHWADKVAVGLEPGPDTPPQAPPSTSSPATAAGKTQGAPDEQGESLETIKEDVVSSLKYPRQFKSSPPEDAARAVAAEEKQGGSKPPASGSPGPAGVGAFLGRGLSVANVRFNSKAETYVKGLSSSGFKTLDAFDGIRKNAKDGSIPSPASVGTTIIKTIWQINDSLANSTAAPPQGQLRFSCETPLTEERVDWITSAFDQSRMQDCLHRYRYAGPSYESLIGADQWHATAVDPGGVCLDDQDLTGAALFPGSCLFYVTLTPRDLDIRTRLQTNLPPEFNVPTPVCASTCTVTLAGIHMMTFVKTKSAPDGDWLWATFWWTPAVQPKLIQDRYRLHGKWAHFQMNKTMSLRGGPSDPPNICFNPYLEGRQKNGIASNCRSCHQYAAIPRAANGEDLSADISRQTDSPTLPSWPGRSLPPDPTTFAPKMISTRMIWSIHSRYVDLSAAAVAAQAKSAAAPAAGKQGVNSAAPKPR
jgi:hypothetical protein